MDRNSLFWAGLLFCAVHNSLQSVRARGEDAGLCEGWGAELSWKSLCVDGKLCFSVGNDTH